MYRLAYNENAGSVCSNIQNKESLWHFRKTLETNTSSRFVWHPSSLLCVYWEHKWRDSRNRRNSRCSCLQGGFQCDSQENASISPQNRTPPRLFTPVLVLLLAPARHCVCDGLVMCDVSVCVCVSCGRRCKIAHAVAHIRGAAGKMQPVTQQQSGCPVLLWTFRKQPDGIVRTS